MYYFNFIRMLFQVFNILFLVAQCAAVVEYTMVTKPPSEQEMANQVLTLLNDARRYVAYETGATNMYWLKHDISLAWRAFKTIDTCEAADDSDGLKQIRLRLSNKKVTTNKSTTELLIFDDLWTNINDFIEHTKENGANIDDSIPEFSKFYIFYRSDWTRVGCVFKVCKDLMTGEDTNLVCYLGPKSERKGPIFELHKPGCPKKHKELSMCKEMKIDWGQLSDDDFQKYVLGEFNGARSKFALKAKASSMSKLIWDATLAQSAMDSGSKCPKTLAHGPNYREVLADPFLDKAAGLSEIGDMYGTTTVEEPPVEALNWTALYTIIWPQTTIVGCARTPNCTVKIACHFGDVAKLEGKMYEKGETCSKCKQECEEGLCT